MSLAEFPALTWAEAFALLSSLVPIAEILIPVFMIASSRPRVDHFRKRATLVLALIGAVTLLMTPIVYSVIYSSPDAEALNRVYSLVSSIVILVCLVPVVKSLYQMSVWQALFCAGAGYTIQNLASGTTDFLMVLLDRAFGVSVGFTYEAMESGQVDVLGSLLVTLGPVAVVYAVAYATFVVHVHEDGLGDAEDHGMVAVLLLVILVVISFDVLIKGLDQVVSLVTVTALRAVHGVVCCFVLFVQFEMLSRRSLELELAQSQQIAAERERQYQLSRANIDAINVKCHDIRHQIRRAAAGGVAVDPEFLADVEREVAVYDSRVETGNEALDTILTEKSLLCEREGISLSVIADGGALGVLSPSEVYSFFGNALDNAIEAVRALDDPGQRSISLTVRRVGEIASIHVENYFAGERSFDDGLPATTKGDTANHGFGTRSMRGIVVRHGGTLTFGQRGRTFVVDAMLPVA